jgi:hypothetical protein
MLISWNTSVLIYKSLKFYYLIGRGGNFANHDRKWEEINRLKKVMEIYSTIIEVYNLIWKEIRSYWKPEIVFVEAAARVVEFGSMDMKGSAIWHWKGDNVSYLSDIMQTAAAGLHSLLHLEVE